MEIRFFSDSFLMHFDLLGFTYLLVVSPLLLRQTVLYTANDPDTSVMVFNMLWNSEAKANSDITIKVSTS